MKSMMFVCRKNSCRSQMAEGFAKTLLKDLVSVTSAGLNLSYVNPLAVQVMSEVGIDISNQKSKLLSDFSPQDYDGVISLCGCGVNLPEDWIVKEFFQDWQLDDPEGMPIETFRLIRDQIELRVKTLSLILPSSWKLSTQPSALLN